MIGKTAFVAGLLLFGALAGPQVSTAATVSPATLEATTDAGTVQQVRWGRCLYWRRECTFRWGWSTKRYYRCLRRHACGGW